jgi:DNA-binding NtrC family response regulator
MTEKTPTGICCGTQREISILVVVTPKRSAEVERIFAHTRWKTHVVHSIREAAAVLRLFPISVVLCEDQVSDGNWLNILRETERLEPRPETIVLSAHLDSILWAEVLNCGGYDLLAMPLEPKEVYAVIPMAWRNCACTASRYTAGAACEQSFRRELVEVS